MARVDYQIKVANLDPNSLNGANRVGAGVVKMWTPTPNQNYLEFARWLYVGTTGNVSIQQWNGTTIVLTGLAAGVFHPIFTTAINSVGTTASGIIVGS